MLLDSGAQVSMGGKSWVQQTLPNVKIQPQNGSKTTHRQNRLGQTQPRFQKMAPPSRFRSSYWEKKDHSLCLCVDFRGLKRKTRSPSVATDTGSVGQLRGNTWFSIFDQGSACLRGIWQSLTPPGALRMGSHPIWADKCTGCISAVHGGSVRGH